MPFKVSFFSTQQSTLQGGWSENFWSSKLDLPACITAAQALRTKLDNLHGDQTVTPYIRISDSATFRDVKLIEIPTTPVATLTLATTSDYPSTALLLKMTSAENYVTRQWIRGLPDNIIRESGRYRPVAAYLADFNAFIAVLTSGGNGWSMRVLDRTVPKKVVQNITAAGVVTVLAHGYAANAKVRISRAKGLTQANSVWRVTPVDADTFSLQGWVTDNPSPVYLGNGEVRLQTYVLKAIANVEVVRSSAHKTGRPFGLLGGRRRTRRT